MLKYLVLTLLSTSLIIAEEPDATETTKALNQAVLTELPFNDTRDFEFAKKGFIAPLLNNGIIKDLSGKIIWNLEDYNFIKDITSPPVTVNPSLWRQAKLLMNAGLYKVVDRIYQVRGADLSNMTIVEGKTGIIIIDTLVSTETAKAALELYFQNRPKKPIIAIIFSHSHMDHFGGVRGIISESDIREKKIKIIAPKGFTESALSENFLAGNAMGRRASYMYGNLIPKSVKGQITAGLGLTTSSGTLSFLPPTDEITKPIQTMSIDGLTFEFMLAPDTEAPSEMHFYIKELKALSTAENAVHNMHNLYTLRGAPIRNAKDWSQYLNETRFKWGEQAEVLFGMHQWPVWGKEELNFHLSMTADVYKYMHDQTLHLANQGFTKNQIGEMLVLPKAFQDYWSLRGYYGNTSQNVKSIYEYYLGWFDGNPANLNPLPPVEASKKYVEYMGGANAIMEKAKTSFANGEYRWVAEVLNHVVFADPSNQEARNLEADAFVQLGYQTETGPWRDFYLSGAEELRNGIKKSPAPGISPDILSAVPQNILFDYMAIQLNSQKAQNKNIVINWDFPDLKSKYLLSINNSVLNYREGFQDIRADVTIQINRSTLNEILLGTATFAQKVTSKEITLTGNPAIINEFFSLLDQFDFWFNLVTPNEAVPVKKTGT